MRRVLMCALGAVVFGAGHLQAQDCRRYADGTVVVCRRERDRDGDRERERSRHRRWERAPVELGVRGGYDFKDNQGSAGAQLRVPLIRQLAFAPSFDAFLGGSGARWQVNADAIIKPDPLAGLYFGGGAAFLRREFDVAEGTEVKAGYNLLVGLDGGRISGTTARPFAEGRWTGTSGFHAFRLVAGVNVPIARGFGW